MTVILDTGALSPQTYKGYMASRLFLTIARAQPSHHFLYPAGLAKNPLPAENLKGVLFPAKTGLFQQKKMRKWLEEQKAAVFFSFDRVLQSKKTLRQVYIVATAAALNNEKAIRSADAVIITSSGLSRLFTERYAGLKSSFFLIDDLVEKEEAPVTAEDLQYLKSELTEDQEYFICADFGLNGEQLTDVLKGFSLFKKRQQSSWKMMVVLRSTEGITKEQATLLLSNYKYRRDVVLTGGDRLPLKMAGAYALISVDGGEKFPVPVSEVLLQGIPAIAMPTVTTREMYGDAVVYLTDAGPAAIGDVLMMMYKGETFRQNLVKQITRNGFPGQQRGAAEALDALLQQ